MPKDVHDDVLDFEMDDDDDERDDNLEFESD